jgi:hypothetical protein
MPDADLDILALAQQLQQLRLEDDEETAEADDLLVQELIALLCPPVQPREQLPQATKRKQHSSKRTTGESAYAAAYEN